MTGQATNAPTPPAPESKLEEAVRKRNHSLDAYWDKRSTMETIADEIRRLHGPAPQGVDKTLARMSDIESLLDAIEDMLVELGCIPEHGGYFDIPYYRWMRLERRIADRQIDDLSEIPEEFQDDFSHLFDNPGSDDGPRDTEAIRDDIAINLEELGYDIKSYYDFSDFMPQGRTKGSPKLDALRDELNERWDEFKSAATAVAHHF